MNAGARQSELIGLKWHPTTHPFRLRVNDVVRVGRVLGRVIRVSDCSAVVLVNRPARTFTTRFDKRVRLQPSPRTIRISVNSEIEILNRPKLSRTSRRNPKGNHENVRRHS